MNTHKLLSEMGYNGNTVENYPQLAKAVANKAKSGCTETELKDYVLKCGMVFKSSFSSSPISYPKWGTVGIDFEYGVIEQMNKAMRLPVAKAGAIMPDAHPGYALPIGGVIALENAVSPSFVGFDIACRMTVTILDVLPEIFLADRLHFAKKLLSVAKLSQGTEFSETKDRQNHEVLTNPLWQELRHLKQRQEIAWKQLGTLGSGNHFANLMLGTMIDDGTQFVALMTHGGSRKVGQEMAKHYAKLAKAETKLVATGIPNDYEWLDITKDTGREYLQVMELMGQYAQANHHITHDRFLEATGLKPVIRYENHHNFAWVEGDTVIHRKGATPAKDGQIGIIPGSSGTKSYIVNGLGNPDSLQSSSHGAGRPCSRTKAKERFDAEYFDTWMVEQDILYHGVAPDEALSAYKDIEAVMRLQSDLVRPVAEMVPLVTIMGGGERYSNFRLD